MEGKEEDIGQPAQVVEKYSVFTTAERWCIVILASFAAWFSTVNNFVYYPAMPLLASTFNVSIDKINLTVTSYIAVATIAPTLAGDAADVLGRRPVYLVALSLYLVANIAIALTHTYSALLGLRVLQALAVSGTISIAYGVVTDIASPAERGSFVSAVSFAVTIAPSLGPILGGALTYAGGWVWIFWFLAIAAGLCLVLIIFLLPETSRNIVGDGSMRPPKHLRLPVPGIMSHWQDSDDDNRPYQWRVPNPFKSLVLLIRPDNTVVMFAIGILYLIYTCYQTSISTLFIDIYGLNQWQAGLVYLPFGLGGTLSTFFSGRLLDKAYHRARVARGLSTDKAVGDDLDNFPVEKARLTVIWIPLLVSTVSTVGIGWILQRRLHIAIALSVQFIAGMALQIDFSVYNTLLADKNWRNPAAAQAASSIIRCTLAAIGVAFLQQTIDWIGTGWTFTLMGGLCLVATAFFLLDYHKGTKWRQKRLDLQRQQ